MLGTAELHHLLDGLGVMPRILLATDGTLTHILEAYTAESVSLVKLSHDLLTDPVLRATCGLDDHERALRRIILLRGSISGATFVYADSVVMLDRLPDLVADGLQDTDTPIGKLLFSCRAETFREILAFNEGQDPRIAAHFGVDRSEVLVSRTYQIVLEGKAIARIVETFPKTAFPATGLVEDVTRRRTSAGR